MILASLQMHEVLDSPSKVAILRILASRQGMKATGREIAKLSGFSVPSTHDSLKSLHDRQILNLEIIGKQHIYTLNEEARIVQKIIRPMFEAESGVKNEMRDFLLSEFKKAHVKQAVVSLILYGSAQKGTAHKGSDLDVAIVVDKAAYVSLVSKLFIEIIMPKFKAYFGAQVDPYIKSALEFRHLLKKNQSPVSTLIQSYSVLYGKEPLEI
jgi:predicted nucleotidyltransferase